MQWLAIGFHKPKVVGSSPTPATKEVELGKGWDRS